MPSPAMRWLPLTVAGLALLGAAAWLAFARHASRRGIDAEAEAALARGREQLKRGAPIAALEAVARLSAEGPHGADVLAVRGLALAALNRPEEARRPLERTLALDPKQPLVAKVLAAIAFSRHDNARGFALLRAAAALDPDDFRPWYAAGDVYRRLGRHAEAGRAFAEALRRDPEHHESRVGLIAARLATGHAEDVAGLLEEALRSYPDDPEVLGLAARQARATGQSDAALEYLERCLAIAPDHVEALVERARWRLAAGRAGEALPDAERAVERAPDNLAALHLLALVESSLGMKERAAASAARHRRMAELLARMQELQRQIEAHPDDPGPRVRLGEAAAEVGRPDMAAASFRAALAIDPDSQPARRGLAALGAAGR